jgi:centrosomal protein CEP76
MKTTWDGKLSYLISPALVNYELERIANQTYGNEEFKQSVKNYVSEGYIFKGNPVHSIDKDPDGLFASIVSSEIGKDILHTRGDNSSFAIRCKIYAYPQNVISVWVMIAVKFRPIK